MNFSDAWLLEKCSSVLIDRGKIKSIKYLSVLFLSNRNLSLKMEANYYEI